MAQFIEAKERKTENYLLLNVFETSLSNPSCFCLFKFQSLDVYVAFSMV